jgi:hypothetical protein
VRASEEFAQEFPLLSGIQRRDDWLHRTGLLSMMGPVEWDASRMYLQVETLGYMGRWVATYTEESFVALIKSALGTSVALRILEPGASYMSTTFKCSAYVHESVNDNWEIIDKVELDEQLSSAISNLKVDSLNGTLTSDEEKSQYMMYSLGLLSKVTKSASAERLLLASKWLFESHAGRDELLSFIQAAVALEIVLGDKETSDAVGLSALLRNRCAYLIGNTHAQRETILKDFADIYEVRSRIVHRGKDRLRLNERGLMRKLRWMVNRVIQEEIKRIE